MTIEFVVLMPVFIFILLFTVDASVLFLTRSDMTNVARDVVRRMSTRELDSTEAVNQAKAQLLYQNNAYNVVATDKNGQETVQITTTIADASIFGFFGAFTSGDLSASVTMRKEP